MFEEESLHCSKNTTGTTLVLEYRIVHFLIEIKALSPGWMKARCTVPEKKCFDSLRLLRSQGGRRATLHTATTRLIRVLLSQ